MVALMLLPVAEAWAAVDERVAGNRVIYEVFVRNFSQAGNFKGVEAQVPRLKELGVDVIWLMPIYKLGDTGKWGTYSSPYAVKDYKGIDPDNGSAADLHDLINTIHGNGMEVWFDWVGNHTAMDNGWVHTHPEYYTRRDGQFVHPFNGAWADVYELDRDNSAMHEAMIDAMQYWVDEFDIDGYRCDYASGPSETFWQKATSRVLKNGKRIAWLAEDDPNYQLVSNGYFDYNYAWSFYDRMRDFAAGGSLADLRAACEGLHSDIHYSGHSRMVFLSNHDRVQDDGGTEDRFFGARLKPMTVLQFTVYGMPLLYNGQEIQYKSGAVSLAEKTPIDWSNPDTSMTELITALCRLKHTQPALRTDLQNGNFTVLGNSADNSVFTFRRSAGDSDVIVMLNFRGNQQNFTISGDIPQGTFTETFTGMSVDMGSRRDFSLPAYGYAVYTDGEGTEVTPPVQPDSYYIYIKNDAEWNPLYLYGYNESTGEVEGKAPFGAWPGVQVTETVETEGHTYLRMQLPEWMKGRTYSLIANNNNGSQMDLPQTTFDGDVYLEVSAPVTHHIYVDDQTDWNDVYVYGWYDNMPEVFNGWPGTKFTGSYMVNGIDFKRVEIPSQHHGKTYNLIMNNNSGNQHDYPSINFNRDYYLRVHNDRTEEISDIATVVDSIVTDQDCEPTYYTLTGVRVDHPDKGMFIEVRGSAVRKVLLDRQTGKF